MKRKRGAVNMDDFSDVLVNTAEFIPGRLYFVTLNTNVSPKSTASVHYFAVDTEQCYDSFYHDFGPLNLSILYHYCGKLDRKLSNGPLANKKIVHYTGVDDKNRVNAAFLIGAYAVIKLNFDPDKAYSVLTHGSKKDYVDFRDASIGNPYKLSLLDCLRAVKKALDCGFFDFENFDFFEYEHYERVENGDLNWIVPEKFIAFCGPHNKSAIDRGYPIHSPETYFAYFRRHRVTTIIRLNKKSYDSNRFVQAGFDHEDLFFVDGGIPNDSILTKFIAICENAKGAIAVHCKAGLGRTGTLIACYIMKHYKFSSQEAIAWIRICRPGSIIAHQQTWLSRKQDLLWNHGDDYRKKFKIHTPTKHSTGIYGLPPVTNNKKNNRNHDNMTGIMKKVDSMGINDQDDDDFRSEENKITQGDRLNEIKAQRAKAKQPLGSNLFCGDSRSDRKTFRTKVLVNTTTASTTKLSRVINTTTKSTSSTSNRVLTKRNEMNESQTTRRCSQRKIGGTTIISTKEKSKIQDSKVAPKKKENQNWLPQENNLPKCSSDTKNDNIVKRGKRTLAIEKDKASPHSVKVLRRSHGQNSKECKRGDGKLHLPSVKINKSI